ncbi:hypothetical protein BRD00_09845 [Halobacteriales archaeon QS_8_69_26]|nr:MAG: hypothetical protein BRD00_09845 [Halobacteriales archaeon QS_8_69_26]
MALTVQGFEVSYSCLQGARYRCSTAFTSGRGIWPPAEWVGVRTIEPWWYDSAVVLGGFLLAATLFSLDVLGVLLARFPADE